MSKKKLFGLVGFLATLTLALAACAQMGSSATLAAGEASPVRGGGGVIPTNGQYYTEGLVAVGTGTASAEPEVARVTFGVDLRGDDPAEIVKEAAEKIDRATAAAREIGDVLPALDVDWKQVALLHQFLNARCRVARRHAVVIREILQCCHAERCGRLA